MSRVTLRGSVGLAALALLACLNAVAGAGALAAPAQDSVIVVIGDNWFCAQGDSACMNTDSGDIDVETTISVGDKVTWNWVGGDIHTTTKCAADRDDCPQPHLWDSPVQSSGSFPVTFDTPGTYIYRCRVHPTQMRGTITVAATGPTPAPTAAPSPQPSPEATAQASPESVTPAPASVQPNAVPAGGGAPATTIDEQSPWLVVVAGGTLLLLASVTVMAMLRRRG